jgi:DNA primase
MRGGIPEEKIAEIKGKASIVEVISDFVSLRKAGKNYLGLCPFHSERTPSFTVNEEKGIFHCFGCGTGGSLFNFLMRANNWTFPEAVKELAKRYQVTLPEWELSEEEKRRRSLKARLFEINEEVAAYYHQMLLAQKEGEEGRKYLSKRGIAEKIILEHRLGFATVAWDSLALFLHKKGVPLNLAESLGLIIPRKEGSVSAGRPNYFDRFRRRVIFPIINEGGRVAGFGGRIVDETPGTDGLPPPKYMNSPESAIYSKGQMFYGLNAARGAIREQGQALIVEGYLDLLSLHQEGIRNVVASLGTALTPAQVSLLGRYAREAVLVFDADESGRKATQRSLEIFLTEGISAQVASLPAGFDPDSFVRKEKAAGFRQILEEALPVVDYMLQQALRRHGTQTVEGKVRVVRELLPALSRLRDPLEQNLYIEQMAQRVGLKESQIRDSLQKKESPTEREPAKPKAARGPVHERLLLQLMLLHNSYIPVVEEALDFEGLSDPRYRRVGRELIAYWKIHKEVDIAKLLLQIEEEDIKNLISELLLEEERVIDADRMFQDCLRKLKISRVLREIHQVDEEIRQRSQQAKQSPAGASGLKELLKRKQRLMGEQKKWMGKISVGGPLRGGMMPGKG